MAKSDAARFGTWRGPSLVVASTHRAYGSLARAPSKASVPAAVRTEPTADGEYRVTRLLGENETIALPGLEVYVRRPRAFAGVRIRVRVRLSERRGARAAGGPIVLVFHTRKESKRLYSDVLENHRRNLPREAIEPQIEIVEPEHASIDVAVKEGEAKPHRAHVAV